MRSTKTINMRNVGLEMKLFLAIFYLESWRWEHFPVLVKFITSKFGRHLILFVGALVFMFLGKGALFLLSNRCFMFTLFELTSPVLVLFIGVDRANFNVYLSLFLITYLKLFYLILSILLVVRFCSIICTVHFFISITLKPKCSLLL